MLQFGKCRTCKGGLSLQYPIVELLSGLALVCIPEAIFSVFGFRFASLYGTPLILHYLLAGIFTVATLALILASAIDARLMILPDSLTAFVALLGVMSAFLIPSILDGSNGALNGSFLGSYATLSGFQDSIMANRLAAALIGALWLTLIVLVTRGRGMGIGDIKLAGALGFLLGWPDAVVGLGLGFILGALASILLLVCGKAGLKSSVPFGPFIVLGASAVVLWGRDLAAWYFNLFP
jgi:leader peptidase (prepilin peptidase)/N-methyltransferase